MLVAESSAATLMQYDARKKNVFVAYLLWMILGGFGAHRFYMGEIAAGVFQLLLTATGVFLLLAGESIFGLAIGGVVGVWLFIDLFMIPGTVKDYNTILAHDLSYRD